MTIRLAWQSAAASGLLLLGAGACVSPPAQTSLAARPAAVDLQKGARALMGGDAHRRARLR